MLEKCIIMLSFGNSNECGKMSEERKISYFKINTLCTLKDAFVTYSIQGNMHTLVKSLVIATTLVTRTKEFKSF